MSVWAVVVLALLWGWWIWQWSGCHPWWVSIVAVSVAQSVGWLLFGHNGLWSFAVGLAAISCFAASDRLGRLPNNNPSLMGWRCALLLVAMLFLSMYWAVAIWQEFSTPQYDNRRFNKLFVIGTTRDLQYLRDRGQDSTPGSTWDINRQVGKTQSGFITQDGFDDLRAGYTLRLARRAEGPGWLSVRRLSLEAREELRQVLRRQQAADDRHFAGHWVDPTSGKLMPYRFYQPDGSTEVVRVVGGDIQYGPQGEAVFDVSLYHNRPEFVVEVRRQHLHPEAPYIGRAGPEKPWRPW